jgi:hypothetical protein
VVLSEERPDFQRLPSVGFTHPTSPHSGTVSHCILSDGFAETLASGGWNPKLLQDRLADFTQDKKTTTPSTLPPKHSPRSFSDTTFDEVISSDRLIEQRRLRIV